jgi:glutamate racemase
MPTIGVFDSGFGGLTVLRALLPLIPGAHYIYLGDTARLPYGAKSQTTIARYAVESARFLAQQGCDHLVIACNTATALALPEIKAAVSIPVTGVIQPGAQAVHSALFNSPQLRVPQVSLLRPGSTTTPNPATTPEVLVLATTATVQSHAYREACAALNLHATEKACPLLVPLVEEGWTDHPVTREVLRIYLTEALAACNPSAVLLGCTHYPLIASEIEATLRSLNSQAIVIDSAAATANAVATALKIPTPQALNTPVPQGFSLGSHSQEGQEALAPATFTCYATDSIEKFQRLGSQFLHQPLPTVHLLDIGG